MNQNLDVQAVTSDTISTDESDNDYSVADLTLDEANEPMREGPNIANVQINNSSDVTFGNRIIYQGPVTMYQQVILPNGSNPQVAGGNINRSANILSQPVFTAEASTSLRIVERSEWNARPPARELKPLELPAVRVIIGYTMGKCAIIHRECAEIVKNYQEYHIQLKGWDDIAYNFMVGGDGSVYVGRGWDFQGAHSKVYNKRSICIAFIGTFSTDPPPERSLIAAQKLIKLGVDLKKIANDYRLYGQRQLIETVSPGNIIYEIIQTWDHWTKEVMPP